MEDNVVRMKVKEFHKDGYHICIDDNGNERRILLHAMFPYMLVGKAIYVKLLGTEIEEGKLWE